MPETKTSEEQAIEDQNRAVQEAHDEQDANNREAIQLRAAELVREYGDARAAAAKAASEDTAKATEEAVTAEKPEQFKVGSNMGPANEAAFRDISTDSKVAVEDFGNPDAEVDEPKAKGKGK